MHDSLHAASQIISIRLDAARLTVLDAAHALDLFGNKKVLTWCTICCMLCKCKCFAMQVYGFMHG